MYKKPFAFGVIILFLLSSFIPMVSSDNYQEDGNEKTNGGSRTLIIDEHFEGTWITSDDPDDPFNYKVPVHPIFGEWDIDGLCYTGHGGGHPGLHYISQMANWTGHSNFTYDGDYCAGAWWAGSYSPDPIQDEWLKTPEMDLRNASDLELSFYGIWCWNSPYDDHVYIKVSTDNETTWTVLADLLQDSQYEQGSGGPGGYGWCWNEYQVVLNLSAYDHEPSVVIAYHLKGDPTMYGVNYIDAFVLTGTVQDYPPNANYTYAPFLPDVDDTINFTDNSFDLDGTIEEWYWDFGDGNISFIQNPTHQYNKSGTYSATLTVTDNDGMTDDTCKSILVNYPIMRITNITSGWNFISLPFNQTVNPNQLILKYNGYYYNWTMSVTDRNPSGSPLVNAFMFGWNRITQSYLYETTMKSGYGYWLYSYQPSEIFIQTDSIPDNEYITNVEQNWNIISIPYNISLNKTNIKVGYMDVDYTWDDAVSNGIIDDFVFGWDRNTPSYTFADMFMPGYAYWMYAYQDCAIYTVLDNFTIKAKYYYFRSYRNGGGIFPIYMIPRHDFDGNASLSINADANLTAQLDRNILNTSSMVAELTIRPNNNTSIDTHAIELFATQENTSQNIYLEVEMINVTIGEPDSYLTGKRDEFISWLESEHPEFGNLSDENWFAYKTYPQILVVSHWTFLSLEWEFRICCHITIPPYNWSKMCLRRFGEIEPVLAAHREYDGITYEIPVDDYPIKYGY